MRLNLSFREHIDLEALEKGIKVITIRVIAQIRFKTSNGWTESFPAIVDTGSPVSVVPKDIWGLCLIEPLYKSEIRGIVSGEDIYIPATFGKIKSILIDEETISSTFEANAFFADAEDIPLILGFSEMLDRMRLIVDYPQRKCWVEV